jgi:hypothetical protein
MSSLSGLAIAWWNAMEAHPILAIAAAVVGLAVIGWALNTPIE